MEHKYVKITVEKADGTVVEFVITDPASEPVFLLRGQDQFAYGAVRFYAQVLRAKGLHDQAAHAGQYANDMDNWPIKKVPD